MSRRRLTLASLLFTALAAGAARAQVVGTLGAGTGRITYDDTPRLTVVSLTPAVMFEGERTTVSGLASFTRFDGGIWSAQAIAAGSRFTEARGLFRGELSAQMEMNSHRGTLRTAQAIAQGRGHLVGAGDRGLWLGLGAGHAWRSPDGGALRRADAGAWAQLGAATLRLTAAHNTVQSKTRLVTAAPNMEANVVDTRSLSVTNETVRYVDTEAHLSWSHARVAIDAAAGRRSVRHGGHTDTWLFGGSVMLTERLALVGSTGTSAFDIAQGLPGGRYATIALRVTTRAGGPLELRSRSRATARGMETWREQDGTVLLVVHAPRARRVELMGDFTDWRPLVMQREADDHFAARIRLPAGSYRINVRVDGGTWMAPPGTTQVADEYNGAAGLLVIGS
ncbi:MAG TPA: glycogen-binding domain-containing protein [Gemmatimonadaceae bacterium]|nr:glycogen-binding domain-containing protein [Gemmatimonadaceae bacterium]